MIGFGELRKKSVEWQTEISDVEKIYALDWLLKGLFDRAPLRDTLTLRGASALASAYFPGYPRLEDIDLGRDVSLEPETLEREIGAAVTDAAHASGLQFRLSGFKPTEARVEFTGPLGRRSAAQPLIVARFVPSAPRSEPTTRRLIHPFRDECVTTVRAIAFNELAAERIVAYGQKPRARDVYDLWFILTQGASELDDSATRALAEQIASEKGRSLHPALDEKYSPLLDRAWENALKSIRPHPSFTQARSEIESRLSQIV
jgi:predicted nucleotidyltransferase component of viral defense system